MQSVMCQLVEVVTNRKDVFLILSETAYILCGRFSLSLFSLLLSVHHIYPSVVRFNVLMSFLGQWLRWMKGFSLRISNSWGKSLFFLFFITAETFSKHLPQQYDLGLVWVVFCSVEMWATSICISSSKWIKHIYILVSLHSTSRSCENFNNSAAAGCSFCHVVTQYKMCRSVLTTSNIVHSSRI